MNQRQSIYSSKIINNSTYQQNNQYDLTHFFLLCFQILQIEVNIQTNFINNNYYNKMSKVSPFLEEVVYLVADFLKTIEYNKQADKLRKQFELPNWAQKSNPVLKKGLKKILKDYINSTQKVLKYYETRKPQQQQVQQQEQKPMTKQAQQKNSINSPKRSPLNKPFTSPKLNNVQVTKPKGWIASQFAQPKRLQDIQNDLEEKVQSIVKVQQANKAKKSSKVKEEEEQASEQIKNKKQKKAIKKEKKEKKDKKTKGPVDTSYLNSEEEFQLEDQKKKHKKLKEDKKAKQDKNVISVPKPVTRKTSTQIEQQKIKSKQVLAANTNRYHSNQNNSDDNGPKKFFSRIDVDEVGFIPENRRNNTFQAKAEYGVGDQWGKFGYDKLKVTRGDAFKKTKGKLKNKSFQGSGINIDRINSVPIL